MRSGQEESAGPAAEWSGAEREGVCLLDGRGRGGVGQEQRQGLVRSEGTDHQ